VTSRDVRDAVLDAWEDLLRPHFGNRDAHVLALQLAVAAEGRGVRFTAPARTDDPAADWTRPVQATPPTGDWAAARAALNTTPEQP
jgi:hypothetical protein